MHIGMLASGGKNGILLLLYYVWTYLYAQTITTYVNPVMPGNHSDLTLFKDGNDFYSCGSSFHFIPYLPVLHSKDLVHREVISRVVPSSWTNLASDAVGKGIWQRPIAYFYNAYWLCFSNTAGGGQYFCKATSPLGRCLLQQESMLHLQRDPPGMIIQFLWMTKAHRIFSDRQIRVVLCKIIPEEKRYSTRAKHFPEVDL